ncbi:hypothetical protein AVEN_31039-1 [Araneus ventricosus]|uniref:Secreted protein n=1 Tax=Araneus ventricosus TaxID=182803 RepID=A0A4Y2K1P8_ARAVE|nr:hypothetical protein AVEN_31039-1 [Araneus ventricosus]
MQPATFKLFSIEALSLVLVIFTPRLEATRMLFWDGPRHSEQKSDDENDTRAGTAFSKLPRHTSGRTFGPDGFNVHQASLHGGSLVKSGFESETLRPRPYHQSIAALKVLRYPNTFGALFS